MSAHTPSLRRRPARVIPAVLVCLVVLIAAGYLVWAIIVRLAQGAWPAPLATGVPELLATRLSHPGVLTAAIIAAVVGLVLILCAVVPGRYRSRSLHISEDLHAGAQQTVLTHRGLGNILRARTNRLDGVGAITTKITDRRATLIARTPLRETGEVTEKVRVTAEDTIRRIPFAQPPTMRVRAGRRPR